jgi:hypothetical protein
VQKKNIGRFVCELEEKWEVVCSLEGDWESCVCIKRRVGICVSVEGDWELCLH